jgi:hypothetical protein
MEIPTGLFHQEGNDMEKWVICSAVLVLAGTAPAGGVVSGFEDLSLPPEGEWNGSDLSGGFTSGLAWYPNHYNPTYLSWYGFACSNRTDTHSTGMAGEYTAMAGSGAGGSANYAVSYVASWDPQALRLAPPGGLRLDGGYFTNNAYAYWSMKQGDAFARKFGGPDGTDADWFLLTITGYDASMSPTGSVEIYLADYRFPDSGDDYIVTEWTWVDLSGLGQVKALGFALTSSDVGLYGMNTPAYFALDGLVPEPAGACLLAVGAIAALRRRRRQWRRGASPGASV